MTSPPLERCARPGCDQPARWKYCSPRCQRLDWYAQNRAKVKAQSRAWKQQNPQRAREHRRRWQEKNAQQDKERRARWRRQKAEEIRARARARYRKKHGGQVRPYRRQAKFVDPPDAV